MYFTAFISLFGRFEGEVKFCLLPLELKVVSLDLLEDELEPDQFLLGLFLVVPETIDIFFEDVVPALGVLHDLFDELNAPVFLLHLIAK
jgi:hypothetical protein